MIMRLNFRKERNKIVWLHKNSRDRKKAKIENIESENIYLKYEWVRLKEILTSYIDQLDQLKLTIDSALCNECKLLLALKVKEQADLMEEKTKHALDDNKLDNDQDLEIPNKIPKIERCASNLTWNSLQLSTDNTSIETFELEFSQNITESPEGDFKLPAPKRRLSPAISISLGSNIPLNLFTIFCSLALVMCFMWICFFSSNKITSDSLGANNIPSK